MRALKNHRPPRLKTTVPYADGRNCGIVRRDPHEKRGLPAMRTQSSGVLIRIPDENNFTI